MNREDTRRAAEVMLHEADGGKVERLDLNHMQSGWMGHVVGHWDWTSFDYRKKPEPIECWVNVLDGETCSTVYMTKEAADEIRPKMSDGWTTRKFREVLE